MKTQHTPGPWKAVIDAGKVVGIFSAIQNPEEDWHGPHGQTIVETDCGYYPPGLADALLIAAAPENFECNKELAAIVRELCGAYGHPWPEASLARSDAAIAKATGEQP